MSDNKTATKNPDITKRKRTQEALIDSEARYRRLFETAQDGILILDAATGMIVDVNPFLIDMLGYSHEQFMGKQIWELGFLKDFISNRNKFAELQRQEYIRYENLPLETADGRHIAVEFVSNVYLVDHKKVIQCNIRDITERKRTQEALIVSEARYRRLFETAQDGILILDAETGMIVDVNPFLIEMLGYSHEQLMDKAVWELGFLKDVVANRDNFLELQQQEYIRYEDLPLETADGRHIAVEFVSNVYLVDHKKVIQCNIRDITERKQIEAGLETTRKELAVIKKSADEVSEFAESVINTVREPLISLDQDLRVVSVSRSFYEFFKVKPEETIGQLIYDLGNKQWDIPKLRELLETVLPQKTTFDNYQVEHNFATIGRRIMLLNARQIERGLGKERVILLAIEDITKRKEIEAGLEKAHEELKELATELERAARVKSEFLANMSHELRTPLNSINGFSEVLYDETFGPLNEKQKKYVNNILTSGQHLLLLINQILDMAKVEAGKMKLALSSLPMKSLLNDISMLVADMVSKKKIEMLLEIAEDLPNIEADDLKVKEILYNLLSNAVKFTPEGGKLGMRAKKADSEIEIVVWDTGIGIAPENMGKLFEGFFRVDTPYSRVTEGTGLGLPLSKKLVELHGGKLSVESEGLDKGTKVIFTLPIIQKVA